MSSMELKGLKKKAADILGIRTFEFGADPQAFIHRDTGEPTVVFYGTKELWEGLEEQYQLDRACEFGGYMQYWYVKEIDGIRFLACYREELPLYQEETEKEIEPPQEQEEKKVFSKVSVTTDILINALEDMGFALDSGEARIYIKDRQDDYLIASVCERAYGRFNTDTEGFGFLEDWQQAKLVELLMDYAITPVAERK